MKTNRLIYFLVISSMIILFCNCERDERFELGDTQSDFVADSVYKTSSDGLLFVQLITPGMFSRTGVIIYAGKTDNPTDTIGMIKPFGSITLLIKKSTYWKVTPYAPFESAIEELIIQWTPMKSIGMNPRASPGP